MSAPLKAYRAVLPARVEKSVLIWGDSAADARQRFYDLDDGNFEVMDQSYFEGKLSRPVREPHEDRAAASTEGGEG